MALKQGPLTRAELLDVWRSAVDVEYARAIEEAGDGQGFEVPGQAAEQLARVAQAVDVSTQAQYILPWSGQSNPPASGETNSTVTLAISRSKRLERPLVLAIGSLVEEVTTDWGYDGPVVVRPGRRYALSEDLVFQPGERGPFDVLAVAERPGWGYDNVQPETIVSIFQPGSTMSNDLADVVITPAPIPSSSGPFKTARLVGFNEPDMPVPDHVGQHVLFTAGANVGKVGRAIVFRNPDPPLHGSSLDLEYEVTLRSATFAGTFEAGESVAFDAGAPPVLGYGVALGTRDAGGFRQLTAQVLSGVSSTRAIGAVSGASITGASAIYPEDAFITETEAAEWRILDWARDFGLEVTNELAPSGGRLGTLDALGAERECARAPGELDDSYRQRVAAIADTVAPNAIRRALNRALGTLPWCFREVGYPALRGWFYDGTGVGAGNSGTLVVADKQDAYDTDVMLFTGALGIGMTWDDGPYSAFDAAPFPTYYDGSGNYVGTPGAYEPLVLEEMPGFLVKAYGYFGRVALDPNPAPPVEDVLIFNRTAGYLPTSLVNHRIRGLFSGALFFPASGTIPATVNARRFRRYFDYAEFRAFFLVGMPRLAMGEFGFAYDSHPRGAYDAKPYDAFYDGSPRLAAEIYRRAWQAVERVHAGGVLFKFYLEDIGCP